MTQIPLPDQFAAVPAPPVVSIVVTHRNYSHHIRGALQSLLGQTYANWECVVVDDYSSDEHLAALRGILADFSNAKLKIKRLEANVGQIQAVYAGLEETSGAFVCILDPDDRYAPSFLAECVAAHLNPVFFAPILSTDQMYFTEQGVITGVVSRHRYKTLSPAGERFTLPEKTDAEVFYIGAQKPGWHWTSTSALMFRRAAFSYMRPLEPLPYKRAADAYFAAGAHFMGGTLFLSKALVYRGVHGANSFQTPNVLSMDQSKMRAGGVDLAGQCAVDVTAAIIANGGAALLPSYMREGYRLAPRPSLPRRAVRWVGRRLRRLLASVARA